MAAIDALVAREAVWPAVNVASTPVLAAVRSVSTDAAEVVTTVAEVTADVERDKILTAAEAVEYGLIDQVLESRKAKPQA